MLVELGGELHHIEPACVTNDRALAPFFWNEVLLTAQIRDDICKGRIKLVRNGQVERLQAQVQLVGAAPDTHEPIESNLLDPRRHALIPTRHFSLTLRWGSNKRFSPVRKEYVYRLGEGVKDI